MYAKIEFDSSKVSRVREEDIANGSVKLGWQISPTGRSCFVGYVYPDTRDVRKALKVLAYNKIAIFFDCHGQAWRVCQANEQDAQRFGPSGWSRPLNRQELDWLGLYSGNPDRTPLEMAQGRIVPYHAWNCLIT